VIASACKSAQKGILNGLVVNHIDLKKKCVNLCSSKWNQVVDVVAEGCSTRVQLTRCGYFFHPSPRGDSSGTVAAACSRSRHHLPLPPILPCPSLPAGGKGSGGPAFNGSSPNRVHLGLGFACCRYLTVELGFAGGAWLLCSLVFLAASAKRKRRHCREIISPSFFRSPMAIFSDANREAWETCIGVRGRRIVVFFRWCWLPY
jgi:hypothetical protein